MAHRRFVEGIASALLGAISWGFSGACIQFLFSSYTFEPLLMTSIRMLGSGLIFLAALVLTRKDQLKLMLLDKDALRELLVFGVFGLFACSSLYTTTVYFTNAGTATVLQTLNTAILLGWVCITQRRRPERFELVALVCAFVATYLIATGGDPSNLAITAEGLVFGLATAVAASFYIAYPVKLFSKWGSFAVTGLGMFTGGVVALLLWLISGGPTRELPTLDTLGIAVLAINIAVGTFGAFGLFLHGVSIVGSVNGSMLGAAEPVSATLFAALWLHTSFAPTDWIGLILMVATVVLIALHSQKNS